jgi:hypothetical protein
MRTQGMLVRWLALGLIGGGIGPGSADQVVDRPAGAEKAARRLLGCERSPTAPPSEPAAEPELLTDRPDFTESSVVVPRGRLQLESGFTWEDGSAGDTAFDLPELLMRWGIARRTEVRLGLPNYFRTRGGSQRTDGFGDTYAGFKYQLGPTRGGLDLAIIPAVSVPTGASGLTSDAVDPEVKLTWARELAKPWSISGMFAFFWPTEEDRRNFTWMPTVSLARSLGGPWGTFLEYAGEFPSRGGKRHILHHGYTYTVTSVSQADLHLGFGLSRAAPDFFIGGGYAVRH